MSSVKLLKINNVVFVCYRNYTILEILNLLNIKIPSFCYHPFLSLEGNCRMCLVEIENLQKPQASCCLPAVNGQNIFTDTPLIQKARENVLQFLLLNHPLDCPICDQGGECDLQDQSYKYGVPKNSNISFYKRSLTNKVYNFFVKVILTRCIHCTRCIRFSNEYLNISTLGALNRGVYTEIGMYISKELNLEFTNNLITICPVGALTAKPYAFKGRPWENQNTLSIDLFDSFCKNIKIEYNKFEIVKIIPLYEKTNLTPWINDRIAFCYDSFIFSRLDKVIYQEKKKHIIKYPLYILILFLKLVLKNFKNQIIINIPTTLNYYSLFLLKYSYKKYSSNYFTNSLKKQNYKLHNTFFFQLFSTDLKKTDKQILLIGLNTRLESSYLNLQLINYQQKYSLKIYFFGLAYNLLLQNIYLGYKLLKIKNYFFTKSSNSKLIYNMFNKIQKIYYNSKLFSRFDGKFLFFIFSKLFFKFSSVPLNLITTSCNESNYNLLNLFNTYPKKITNHNSLSLSYNDIFNKLPYNVMLNSYYPNHYIFNKLNLILPIKIPYEEYGIYLNNLGSTQKTYPIINNMSSKVPSNSKILKKLFYNKLKFNKNIFNLLSNSTIKTSYRSKFTTLLKTTFLMKCVNKTYFNYYFYINEPFSNYFENYYQNSIITKHSLTLKLYSHRWIADLSNFK